MINATKKQIMNFISEYFVMPEGEHPTASQLDVFKKDDLAKVVENSGHVAEFDSYINYINSLG